MNNIQRAQRLRELALEGLAVSDDERYRKILEIADEMADDDSLSISEKHDTIYTSIIHKLAQEYFRIFYVNIETDNYLEYDPFDPDPSLDLEHEKDDFFLQSQEGMFDTLYAEDLDVFRSGFRKERVIQDINDHGEFSLIYRVKHLDGYFFANMKGTRIEGDHDHIIVGVKNIDADVRREKEYLMNLSQAKDEANLDVLTGIRNRHAYLEYTVELAKMLEKGDVEEYAIVVFDINGLKLINDTLGHTAGDRYLKEASQIICEIFSRSPVFRIGGDEFAAIVKGADYANLDHLLDQVELMNRRNDACGGIVIAAGMARSEGCKDIRTVFKRADENMYKNKKRLKSDSIYSGNS